MMDLVAKWADYRGDRKARFDRAIIFSVFDLH